MDGTAWASALKMADVTKWPTRCRAPSGAGGQRVEDTPLRGRHGDRRHGALVVGDGGDGQVLDRVVGHAAHIAERHVDASQYVAAGAAEVDADADAFDRHRTGKSDRLVDAFHTRVARIGAIGPGADLLPHGGFGLISDGAAQRHQIVEPVIVHELDELPTTDLVAGDVGHDVADGLVRHAAVGAD